MSAQEILGILPFIESVRIEMRLKSGALVAQEYGRFPVVDVTSEDITEGVQVVTVKGEVTEMQIGYWK